MDREEFYIKRLLEGSRPSVHGIGDDAALITGSSAPVSVTTDSTVENVHFTRTYHLSAIVHKAIKRSVTDTIAVGSVPRYLVMNIIFPDGFTRPKLRRVASLVLSFTRSYGMRLVGGDTSFHKGPLVITATIIGTFIKQQPITRAGAHAGDYIYMTGVLGRPLMTKAVSRVDIRGLVRLISRHEITAMIDITDGFIRDLARITIEHGKGALVRTADIPLYRGARFSDAARAGEDYEFLFTTPRLIADNRSVALIGRVINEPSMLAMNIRNQIESLELRGWSYG